MDKLNEIPNNKNISIIYGWSSSLFYELIMIWPFVMEVKFSALCSQKSALAFMLSHMHPPESSHLHLRINFSIFFLTLKKLEIGFNVLAAVVTKSTYYFLGYTALYLRRQHSQ
jgi:hypothetical protein